MKRWLSLVLLLAATATASASPIFTLSFSVAGFRNVSGAEIPGIGGPLQGQLSWEADQVSDPIGKLLSIDLTIAGHAYSLAEVGVTSTGSTSVVGGLARGVSAVVGDGLADDFMLIFNRVTPSLQYLNFSVAGQGGALWINSGPVEARYVTEEAPVNQVPEPASFALVALALLALGSARRLTARSGYSPRG